MTIKFNKTMCLNLIGEVNAMNFRYCTQVYPFQICYAMPLVSKMAISKGETKGKNLLLS